MIESSGTPRSFTARGTCANPERVWQRWTDPQSWQEWDKGLTGASIVGEFRAGATGTIVGLDGRRSRFVVDAVDPGRSVRWHVPLPGAWMRLVRTLDRTDAGHLVTHHVQFTGLLSPLWARLLGRRFQPLLGPSVAALIALADAPTPADRPHG